MTQTQKANWVQYATIVLTALLVLSIGFNVPNNSPDVVNEVTENVVDLTEIQTSIDAISEKQNEDDDWENEAIALAEEEYSRSGYKYIAKVLDDIDDKDDIDRIVIKDVEVTSSDADEQDATVIHTLKVYYEDTSGDDVKDYVIVETVIEEGEVEDQEIDLE